MNDFNSQLSTMLDEVAAGINPRPDFEAARAVPVPVVSNGAGAGRRFPRLLGVAAVSVALLGGGVAAFQLADGGLDAVVTSSEVTQQPIDEMSPVSDETGRKSPAPLVVAPQYDEVGIEPGDGPGVAESENEVVRTAELGKFELDGDVLLQKIGGAAEPGELVEVTSGLGTWKSEANDKARWRTVLELTGVPEGGEVPIRVSFERSEQVFELVVVRPVEPKPDTTEPPEPKPQPEPPKPEPQPEPPKPEPQPEPPKPEPEPEPAIPFKVSNGDPYNDTTYLMHSFWGTAPAGSVVTVGSQWGSSETVTGPKGEWELRFKLAEVPDGTKVHVRVSANTGGPVYEFALLRDRPGPEPEPEPIAFTANLGGGHLDWTPIKQGLWGTGTPGSAVIATTEFGSADAVVNSKGKWEMLLKMHEVPDGAKVGIRVTNTASEAVYEFSVVRPAGEPEPIDFTAQAAFTTCDSTPPFNEYWGTSTAGAKITISSDFGSKQVTSNGDGHWEARVEFPEAPVNETFTVTVTSSKGEAVYSFPLTRLGPE